jgi:hypothetical protein
MAFGNMNERGGLRRPATPAATAPPVMPAPPATPTGGLKPNVANEPTMKPTKGGGGRVNPNAAPDPTKGSLPPRFANMVKGGMTEAQARQKWARSLQNRGKLGPGIPGSGAPPPPGPGGPATSPPGAGPVGQPKPSPFVPSPVPAPGAPIYGGPLGGLQGQFGTSPAPGQGGFGPPQGYAGPGSPVVPGGGDFRDPMASFLAAVPMMNMNAHKQIDDALSQFGGGGLRWGTDAAGKAAEIGSENALQQNSMLQSSLQDYARQQEDRALQASGMGLGLGGMLDQQAQDRVKLPFQVGAWEQQRQDDFANQYYQDFERNKLGWLPMLAGAAQGQHGGSQGTLMPMPGEASKPGLADWASIIAQFFG